MKIHGALKAKLSNKKATSASSADKQRKAWRMQNCFHTQTQLFSETVTIMEKNSSHSSRPIASGMASGSVLCEVAWSAPVAAAAAERRA